MIDPSEIMAARQALGRLLAEYRKAAGLNQYQLAPHTCYGRSTIANVETGRQNVPRDFWERCDRAVNAGGRLLAASERLDALVRQQREETARLAEAEQSGIDPTQRGATWTYLTTDQPFGSWTERIARGLWRKVRSRSVWG